MKKIFTRAFIEAALMRAIYTFAEVMLGFMAVGMSVSEVQWGHALSVSLVATVISILKSVVIGMPEVRDNDTSTD